MLSASLSAPSWKPWGLLWGMSLDLFPCHLVSWHVSRTLGALCRKNRPPKWPHGRLFFGTGLLGTAYALSIRSLSLLYLFYGCIGGIGLGTGYITPVSTLVKYFPHHRGFATGLAIMGFGFAALIAAPLMQQLTRTVGLTRTFCLMAGAYSVIMVLCALYLKPPVLKKEHDADSQSLTGKTASEAMHTWQFQSLWWVFFINITCGILLLAVLSPMAQDVIGMSAQEAAAFVGIIGIMNGGGRILWSTISDRLSRPVTYILFLPLRSWLSSPSVPPPLPLSLKVLCSLSSVPMAAAFPACRPI